jgi:hypothetical protein
MFSGMLGQAIYQPDDAACEADLNPWLNPDYERRLFRRWSVEERATVKFSGCQDDCLVHNISPGGACVEFQDAGKLSAFDKISFQLVGQAPIVSEIRCANDNKVGIAFLQGAANEQKLARWLTDKESKRRRQERQDIVCSALLSVDGREISCVLQNVSQNGAKIKGEDFDDLQPGDKVALSFGSVGPIQGAIRYRLQNTVGINFVNSVATMKMLTGMMK